MLIFGTETFEARDFVRTGIVLSALALALVRLLATTYWHSLGYI
jgi:di/tricarboxylate transporter